MGFIFKEKTMKIIGVIVFITKLLAGAVAQWVGCMPSDKQRVYFANHTSNMDTIVIWASLPQELQIKTRPVAAKDYWTKGPIQRYISKEELNVVYIERLREERTEDPLNPLRRALDEGSSLIIFPEGKRNSTGMPQEFKAGLYHLASEYPQVEFIPVYLENVHKSFPKGAFLPLPIICKSFFGAPLSLNKYESKLEFLKRARQCVIDLMPEHLKKEYHEHLMDEKIQQMKDNNQTKEIGFYD